MTNHWTLIALTICLFSCGQSNKSKNNLLTNHSKISVDTTAIAIIPFDTIQTWIFKDCRSSELNSTEIENIEILLTKCIDDFNQKEEKHFDELNKKHPDFNFDKNSFIIDLKKNKRQYFPVINNKGEKEVWINCFCTAWDKNWKTVQLRVRDGGNCFFNLKVNLTTNKYYDFMTNGEG